MPEATILLVEDEEVSADMLASYLEMNQFIVQKAYDGAVAKQIILDDENDIDIAILDIMLPFFDGKELCSIIRKESNKNDIPVIFLTAKDEEKDEIEGLDLGADDYIAKPASFALVLAHVRSQLRKKNRINLNDLDDRIQFADVSLSTNELEMKVGDKRIDVTATEFHIMRLFFENPKRIFSRQEILEKIMPEDHYVFDRTIDVHIKNLRIKLADSGKLIKTYRGVGYGLDKDLAGL